MDTVEMKDRIIDILDSLFSASGVDRDILEYVDLVDDLSMDSLNFISLIIELETEFDIQIPDDWLLLERFREYPLILSAVEELATTKETEVGDCE